LEEQRFANVVAEMAIAANLPEPRVLIMERGGLNAAVFGRDENHATIVISNALLEHLNRDELQGIAAHLVGSIANGDMTIGLRAAVTMSLFGLIARLGTVLIQGQGAIRGLMRILRDTLMPTAARARKLAQELADPFADAPHSNASPVRPSLLSTLLQKTPLRAIDWEQVRPFLWMPLAGPVVLTGFFGGIVSSFILGPLLALAWRQRKYMADATAVRLTRDPDTLGKALSKMNQAGGSSTFASWAAHLSVVRLNSGQASLLGGAVVPMFPALDRRLRALHKLGARIQAGHTTQMPLRIKLIVAPLFAVLAVLFAMLLPLLIWLSFALTMLFTGLPVGIIHLLLRWIGQS
jgi:Zn-dependent protease with chaperone function